MYWDDRLVPMLNSSVIDWRGNSDTAVGKCYKSKSAYRLNVVIALNRLTLTHA